MINYLLIACSAIFLSQEFARYKITNFKPLSCEVCLAFWLTISNELFVNKYLFYILIAATVALATKVLNICLIKFYGKIMK